MLWPLSRDSESLDKSSFLEHTTNTPIMIGKGEYPFECVICMNFYKRAFVSTCCGQSFCYPCILDYIQPYLKKEQEERGDLSLEDIPSHVMVSMVCPYCTVPGFAIRPIQKEAFDLDDERYLDSERKEEEGGYETSLARQESKEELERTLTEDREAVLMTPFRPVVQKEREGEEEAFPSIHSPVKVSHLLLSFFFHFLSLFVDWR